MRRRILQSTLLVVAITALVLGGPLAITTWRLVEDIHRADLLSRLEQVAARLDSAGALDRASIELAVPTGGRLVLQRTGAPAGRAAARRGRPGGPARRGRLPRGARPARDPRAGPGVGRARHISC